MVPELSDHALHLLTVQQNVIATWQVERPCPAAMRRAHNRGQWRRLTAHTYLASPADPTAHQLMWAAALHPGPMALLTGQAALVWDGWQGEATGAIDVLVPADTHPRSTQQWMRLHRTAVMPAAARRGIPRARPAAAVIDAARWARTDREAMFIVVSALQQRVCQPSEVLRLLDDRPSVRRRAVILDVVNEFTGGATSLGEIDFGRLCRRFGIREPDRQVLRWANGRRYLDVHFDAEGVTVEIEGLHHLHPKIWMADQDRQNEVVLDGDRIFLRVATWTIKYEPDPFMGQLLRALRKG